MAKYGATEGVPSQMAMQQLGECDGLEVKEHASILEAASALLGTELEMANRYSIYAKGSGKDTSSMFYAVEKTDFFRRMMKTSCCNDCMSWDVDVLYTGNPQQLYTADGQLYTGKAEPEKFLGIKRSFTYTCCCFNRPVADVILEPSGQKIGSIRDPWALCNFTFDLRDAEDESVYKVDGGCCQWGVFCPCPCGPCSRINLDVLESDTGQKVGRITKQVPSCLKFFLAPDVDNYQIDFEGVKGARWRAMLMAFTLFLDFRYFNDNPNDGHQHRHDGFH